MIEKDIGFVGEVTRVNPSILKVRACDGDLGLAAAAVAA